MFIATLIPNSAVPLPVPALKHCLLCFVYSYLSHFQAMREMVVGAISVTVLMILLILKLSRIAELLPNLEQNAKVILFLLLQAVIWPVVPLMYTCQINTPPKYI